MTNQSPKTMDDIVTTLRKSNRDLFIEAGGPDIPPIAYRIAPEGTVHIIPALVNHQHQHIFWHYVRQVAHKEATAGILLISHARLKPRGTHRNPDGTIDVKTDAKEVLVALLEPKTGPKQYWVAMIHRYAYYGYKSLTVDEWQSVNGGNFESMFGSTN